jgi:carbonic anhydrase/acetyltransferase-like protein (isoleucine patch superfamily)
VSAAVPPGQAAGGIPGPLLLAVGERAPHVHARAWVAPGAVLVGSVELAADSSVWYGCVLRADGDRIVVGEGSNLQDGCVVHADEHGGVVVGAGVSVGHRAVLHGCVVEDGVLVGMGAVVLSGARIGRGSLVAAGAVVREGAQVPAGSLVAGVPAQVRRPLTEAEAVRVRENAPAYRGLTERHRDAHPVSR